MTNLEIKLEIESLVREAGQEMERQNNLDSGKRSYRRADQMYAEIRNYELKLKRQSK